MSRSYKKVPGSTDRNPAMKAFANRRLRKVSLEKTPASGSAYKKFSCSYDICDWKFLYFTDSELVRSMTSVWQRWPGYSDFDCLEDMIANERIKARMK